MALALRRAAFICRRCLQASRSSGPRQLGRYSTSSQAGKSRNSQDSDNSVSKDASTPQTKEPGPMARRLEEATEEALFTGGRAGRQAVEDAGFSEELKERLLDKIADAKFRKQYSGAFAEAGINSAAGEGTRRIAAAQPWTGTEDTADAVLRMLDDAKPKLKPGLRGTFQAPPVDMRLSREPSRSPSQKAATARDRASVYAGLGMKGKTGLTDEEREAMRRELRERFEPGARAMPNTITGLASLANERIENAIARGQFKNIPRGPGVERDARADNPFIDTTEYIMNKMIQRQDMVPPWIEKQQELVKAATVFRKRLRSDWRRHAARMIASKGGPLQEQMKRAEDYAASELVHNPRFRSVDQISVPSNSTDDPVMIKMRQQIKSATEPDPNPPPTQQPEPAAPLPPPFRDPAWEKAELSYMNLSIENLNTLTRSYNLMAPDLAKKPYFSLQRELLACYADVAPLVAKEIHERATGLKSKGLQGPGGGGVSEMLEGLVGGASVRIHLEADEKAYGLKEWWRDFWAKKK